MPTFHDIRIASGLTNSLSRGTFAEFMERETGYMWDGTPEGKLALMTMIESREITEAERVILDLESALISILAQMEFRGVRVDREKLAHIGEQIASDIKRLEIEIYEVTGEFFNLNSPKQVADILFGKLGIKPTKKNKTGYSVDTEVLEEIAKEYDIARLIIEYRTLAKLQSTYIVALLKSIDPTTSRIHTTYSQLGAATGRMSSLDPNLQNIPTAIGYGSDIKSCFIPSDEHVFLVADYSQIEIRVLAWLSGDENLLDAFAQGEDIHARTARFLFPDAGVISADQRRIAKTVNFGVIYGITGFGLAKTLGASPWEADKYIQAFYEKYPKVKQFYEQVLVSGRELGYVATVFGRRRYIPGLTDANKTIRSISEREAINMPIQGTAADMLKLAMVDIDAKIRDNNLTGSMILQVHDELVFDIPKEEQAIWETLVRESLEGVIERHLSPDIQGDSTIPDMLVEIGIGKNWVEAK